MARIDSYGLTGLYRQWRLVWTAAPLILTRVEHDTEDFVVTRDRRVTWLRVTDFWTCVTPGLGRNLCEPLVWLDPEPNPPKTNPNSASTTSRSAMTRWYIRSSRAG